MLGTRMTAQDEEEVEDELAALEAEMSGVNQKLPTVPNAQLPVSDRPAEQEEAQENRPERQAMLAA
jgi:charged multivesicular body protein 6